MLGDLAVSGGAPQFHELRHVGRPNIGNREALHRRIDRMLDDKWLSNDGPLVRELEAQVSALHGVAASVAVCNATLGLNLLAHALGMADEVIMPAFTFVATPHAIQWHGGSPRFADIYAVDHTINIADVEASITERTSGIIGVHTWGRPCDVAELERIAATCGIPVIVDAAHALGVSGTDGPIGGGGSAEVLSLHATKFVNSFEGGIVLTNDLSLAEEIRSLRNFGFTDYDRVSGPGINAKMTEVCAAMGLTSLEALPQFVQANSQNFAAYRAGLGEMSGVRLLDYSEEGVWNFQYVVVEIDESVSGINRDLIVQAMHAEGVVARRYFFPGCHRHAPYASLGSAHVLPVTDQVASRVMVLPTGTAMSANDCQVVCRLLGEMIAGGGDLARHIAASGRAPQPC